MYIPPAFRETDRTTIHAWMRASRLVSLVTCGGAGVLATPMPMLLDADDGENGTLYGHVARANPQWKEAASGDALAIFMGPDAYVSPAWYATKRETGKVVPTWNYVAVHAYGPVEFFDDPVRLRRLVERLTDRHEAGRSDPWAVTDAPEAFVEAQLRAIVGVRMPIARIDAKRKLSQNRTTEDRSGVIAGLLESGDERDRAIGKLME